jgi:hypothetical protein
MYVRVLLPVFSCQIASTLAHSSELSFLGTEPTDQILNGDTVTIPKPHHWKFSGVDSPANLFVIRAKEPGGFLDRHRDAIWGRDAQCCFTLDCRPRATSLLFAAQNRNERGMGSLPRLSAIDLDPPDSPQTPQFRTSLDEQIDRMVDGQSDNGSATSLLLFQCLSYESDWAFSIDTIALTKWRIAVIDPFPRPSHFKGIKSHRARERTHVN